MRRNFLVFVSALDDLLMANSYYTIRADGCVSLRMSDTGYGAVKAITMMTMMSETVQRSPNHIAMGKYRALDKREYLVIIRDNFCLFCIKAYVVTPHLNRLDETVQMRGHNICF